MSDLIIYLVDLWDKVESAQPFLGEDQYQTCPPSGSNTLVSCEGAETQLHVICVSTNMQKRIRIQFRLVGIHDFGGGGQ